MTVSKAVRALAEDPFAHCPDPPAELGFARLTKDGVVVWATPVPSLQIVERLRLDAGDVPAVVVEARSFLRQRGRSQAFWRVTESSTPADLEARLREFGMVDAEPPAEPAHTAMALISPPAGERPQEIEAGPAESLSDLFAAIDVTIDVFQIPREQRATMQDAARHRYEYEQQSGEEAIGRAYVARLDGEIVGTARALFADSGINLIGGSVLPRARGRGVYRALVWARWDDAMSRGTPALTVQAGAMSRSTLERLGFQPVAAGRVLLDRF